MNWNSPLCFVRSLLVCLLVTSALAIGGCDLFGSDSDPPGWVGNWEAVDAKPDSVEYPPEDARILFSITQDSIKTFVKFMGQECDIDATEVVNVDGNVVTTQEEGDDDDQFRTRLETSGNTLTITPLDSESELEEVTAESVDADPASILNCSSSSTSRVRTAQAFGRRR